MCPCICRLPGVCPISLLEYHPLLLFALLGDLTDRGRGTFTRIQQPKSILIILSESFVRLSDHLIQGGRNGKCLTGARNAGRGFGEALTQTNKMMLNKRTRLNRRPCASWRPWIGSLFLLASLLFGSQETFGESTLPAPRPAKVGARPSVEKRASRSSAKRRRRHRRLRVSRSFKPMPPLSDAPFGADVPLMRLVEEAKSQLERETARYSPAKGRSAARRDVKLALAHFKTGEIQIVSGVEQNRRLTLDDPNIRFEVDWWNGFNSSVTIVDPPYTGVVAMLYALEPERQRFLDQDALIYTPYSSALLQTELVEAGRSYLMSTVRQARQELGHVLSRASPGTFLANSPAFSDQDYFDLILTEQMDPGRFRSISAGSWELSDQQEAEVRRLADRILVIIGTNQEDAYSFTGNYASARGLTQFTPMGMSVVWNNYPEAGIPRDFRRATGEHLSAIKAEICLLDHDLAGLAKSHSSLIGSGMEMHAAGAAYNGGPGRVRFGLENFGLAWLHPAARLAELDSRAALSLLEKKELAWLNRNRRHETFVYLNKIHAIRRSQNRMPSSSSAGVIRNESSSIEKSPERNGSALGSTTTLNP